jgi:hypothetical protein
MNAPTDHRIKNELQFILSLSTYTNLEDYISQTIAFHGYNSTSVFSL